MFAEDSFGRYKLVVSMPRTGAGVVYHAMDNDFAGEVAIKFLPPYYYQDPSQRFKFEQEARIIALLENPFITPILEIGEREGRLFIVMRWLEGGSLADRIANGPLPSEEAIDIFYKVAKILKAVHSLGILHRDLKPTNVLFDADGEVYLSDFGMLKLAETNSDWSGGYLVGSPAYVSREAVFSPDELDERVDIFALGSLLFTMITGYPIVDGDSFIDQIQNFSTNRKILLDKLSPDLPEILRAVLVRSLALDNSTGYTSITEMLDDMFDTSESDEVEWKEESDDEPNDLQQVTESHSHPIRRTIVSLSLLAILIVVGLGWTINTGLLQKNLPPEILNSAWVSTPLALINIPVQSDINRINSDNVATVDVHPIITATIEGDLYPTQTTVPPIVEKPINTPTIKPTSQPQQTDDPTNVPKSANEFLTTGPMIGGADKIAFLHENDIWMVDLDGNNLERLTTDGQEKDMLRWTPDGQQLFFTMDHKYFIYSLIDHTLSGIGSFADLDIAPDMKSVVVGNMVVHDREIMKWMNVFADFNLTDGGLSSLIMKKGMKCGFYAGRLTRFSTDGRELASVIQVSQNGNLYEVIEVLHINPCGQDPTQVDYFLGEDFPIRGYNGINDSHKILDYTWDGESRFVLTGNVRNEYGDLITYDIGTKKYQQLDPLQGTCCFSYPRWSPDGTFLLFAFVDFRYGDKVELYYIPWDEISSGNTFTPVDLPSYMFEDRLENIQPALRPVH